jgi:hypothetical protein
MNESAVSSNYHKKPLKPQNILIEIKTIENGNDASVLRRIVSSSEQQNLK